MTIFYFGVWFHFNTVSCQETWPNNDGLRHLLLDNKLLCLVPSLDPGVDFWGCSVDLVLEAEVVIGVRLASNSRHNPFRRNAWFQGYHRLRPHSEASRHLLVAHLQLQAHLVFLLRWPRTRRLLNSTGKKPRRSSSRHRGDLPTPSGPRSRANLVQSPSTITASNSSSSLELWNWRERSVSSCSLSFLAPLLFYSSFPST